MDCNKIKELIGDYIDGEISTAQQDEISSHLKICPSCKRIEQSLRRAVIEPLRKAKKVEAPDRIWYQIKDTLEEKESRGYLPYLITEWINRLKIRKPALVPASVMVIAVLLFTVIFFRKAPTTEYILNTYIEEQMQFIWQLAENGEESYFDIDDVNLDTSIENYLL